ncbi:MAG: beta-glucosidase [Oceanospirillales bacterium TMED33]|nr:beta-glucosidase [Gammaproteobacteria bacterium]RPG19763.1 MAG: beta-glucosidase [Oceanospirillales bacterium TMED33]
MNQLTEPSFSKAEFGDNFVWGVATAAFQIEGAARTDGRAPSIWDTFCEKEGAIADGSDVLIACDHYNRLEEDLNHIAGLGVNAYRFSVSWSRVQPRGDGPWNEKGFDFYDRLISGLEQRGIQAHLTLFHWDLPQALDDRGGWLNDEAMDCFVVYAQEICRRFGHRLASICTFNEPWVISILGYEQGVFAPGIKDRSVAMQVAHNILVTHGRAMRAIREVTPDLSAGIVLNMSPIYPASDDPADVEKAKIDDGLIVRWYMDAIYHGRYPADVITYLGADGPMIKETDMTDISEPVDFVGVNYYTRNFSSTGNPWDVTSTGNQVTDMGWEVYPDGLCELLCRLNDDYNVGKLMVTENGAAFKDVLEDGQINDIERQSYIQSHISATLEARHRGVPVEGYFVWSLLDNFEWASGYEKRFGIIHVDYESLERTPKASSLWLTEYLSGES